MGIVLKVTPNVLVRMANDIEKRIADVENLFGQMDSEISRTRFFWEGEASDLHSSQYEALKGEIGETTKRLSSHPQNLLTMAGLYSETETNAVAAAQSLKADVII